MIQYHFTCTLLSDVIISSASATEGFHPSLDYIPGAKFWGIAAKAIYNEQEDIQTVDIFHNGKVSFGDAHLEINGKRSHKIPLSWFKNKDKSQSDIYVHHAIEDYKILIENGVQPEQLAGDYFNEEGSYLRPTQQFSIKSAYDSKLRRSEDEQMFGYYALPAGRKWLFNVSSESKIYLEKVRDALEGQKQIGRSRSAQYGLAQIKFEKEINQPDEKLSSGLHYLFADSALMLPMDMSLKEALPGIDFARSKIRTRIYQSWNTYRNTRDADRQVIEKGSVLVVKLEKETTADQLLHHLKERSAEGFGDVLIDPPFLTNVVNKHFAALTLAEWNKSELTTVPIYINTGKKDELLVTILEKRKEERVQVQNIDLAVNAFVENEINRKAFRAVTPSQWGTVRSYAKLFPVLEDLRKQLLDEDKNSPKKGYLVSGSAEEKWCAGKLIIDDIVSGRKSESYPDNRLLFLEKLAAEMAKRKREKEKA